MKRHVSMMIPVFLLILASAWAGGKQEATGGTKSSAEIMVGYSVMQLSDAFWDNQIKGMQAAIKESGRNIKLEVADSAYDAQAALQNSISLLDRGARVLIIGAPDPKIGGAVLEKAKAKNAPVVACSVPLEGAYLMTYDDYQSGAIVGEWAGKYFNKHFKGQKAKVAFLSAFSVQAVAGPRCDGFKDAFGKQVSNATYLDPVDSAGQREKGANVMADVLTANPDVNVVFGVNDDCTLGGAASVQARGLSDKVALFGLGGISEEPFKALLDPTSPFKGTVAFSPFEYGRATINQYVLPLLDGKTVPQRINAPLALATADNAASYLKK